MFKQTTVQALRQKAIALSDLFIVLMEQECAGFGFQLASPKEASQRAGHVAYRHTEGHGIYQAIKKEGVISDFRTPDILRFGITPMYLRYRDIYEVVRIMRGVMETGAWDKAEYKVRAAIT